MIKVFVIDDSIAVRTGFRNLISDIKDIELIGEADNPVDAFKVFKKVGLPDIFILDIEMPKMDGLTFLKQINEQRPTPVIICSSLVGDGSNTIIDAMRLGAAEIIEKPKHNLNQMFITYKDDLLQKIRAVSKANIQYQKNIIINPKKVNKVNEQFLVPSAKVIAIGSSTGGIQVLEEIVTHVEPSHVGIVIVQHIPKGFSTSLSKRLDELSVHSNVKEIEDGEVILNNTIYLAPGGIHVEVQKQGLKYILKLKDFPKVNSHRPSVNVLFNSIAKNFRVNSVGFILTGMGDDGATGLKMMKEAGAKTFVQNEKTSTIYGMPRMALELGGAEEALSIFEIINKINELASL